MRTDYDSPVIACNMTAIDPEHRAYHSELTSSLFAAALEVQELSYGYAIRLPTEPDVLIHAAEFIANERLCCPFLHFTLEVSPGSGAFWLQLKGGQGVKQFLKDTMAL